MSGGGGEGGVQNNRSRTNLPRSTGEVWLALAFVAKNAPCVNSPAARPFAGATR
jgi:hypothetical protein